MSWRFLGGSTGSVMLLDAVSTGSAAVWPAESNSTSIGCVIHKEHEREARAGIRSKVG